MYVYPLEGATKDFWGLGATLFLDKELRQIYLGNNLFARKVEKFYLPCLDLISSPSPSMKIQIVGGIITENLGFESLLWKVIFFSFHVQILQTKLGIFDFNHFLISCLVN